MKPTNTANVQTLAAELYEALETRTRTDGTSFITLKDDSPDWMQPVIHEAHLGRMPNDDTYAAIESFLCDLKDSEEADECVQEWADSYVDVYTSQLTAWLATNVENVEYIGEVISEFGGDLPDDGTCGAKLLMMAQYKFYEEIASAVIRELEQLVND